MNAVEFTTKLGDLPVVNIPSDVAARLPKSGSARVIILTFDDAEGSEWKKGALEQFAHNDCPQDAIYNTY